MNDIWKKAKSSIVVHVIVLLLFGNVFQPFAQTVTIYWDQVRQEIDGFGASAAFKQADNLKKFPIATRTEILDLLFSQTEGIGLSMVRNMVGDGSMSEWGKDVDGPIETIQPQKDVWNFDAVDEQIWFMKEAEDRGCTRFFSTVWSPPRWMKTNNSCTRGGSLKTSSYGDFAEYLYQYVTEYMKKRNNIDIYAISVANEPNYNPGYSSCLWTGDQFRNFVRDNLGPKFKDEHKIATKIIIGEHSNWTEKLALPTLNDPEAVKYLDIVGSHNYKFHGYPPFTVTQSKNKRTWQTEVSTLKGNDRSINDGLKWAKQIHDFLTDAEGHAWCYWWTICFKVNPEQGESLIFINTSNKTYILNKRLFTMGNFSRFIRPGWYRISTPAASSGNVHVSAFKNPETNDFAIVAINSDNSSQTRNFKIEGHTTTSVTPYVTSSNKDLAKGNDITISNGSFNATLPAKSVTSFYGKSESTQAIDRNDVYSKKRNNNIDLSIPIVNSQLLFLKNSLADQFFDGIFTIYTLSGKKLIHYNLTNKNGDHPTPLTLPKNMGAGTYNFRFTNKTATYTGVLQLTKQL